MKKITTNTAPASGHIPANRVRTKQAQKAKSIPTRIESTLKARTNKPIVRVDGRQLDALVIETLETLASDPELYCFGGVPARYEMDQHGGVRIRQFDGVSLNAHMGLVANFVRIDKLGNRTATNPPRGLAEAILTLPVRNYPLRRLEAVVRSPIVRADGSIVCTAGYDESTQLIYQPWADFMLPKVPTCPTSEQIRKAVQCLNDLIDDFPFADASSRANVMGMFISPFTRYLAPGPRPLALIEAQVMGTGKTLLMDVWSRIATGRPADLYSPPGDNPEWRKQITSILLKAPMLVCWDNLDRILDSGELSKFLTAEVWADRELGANKALQLAVLCDSAITGNNIQLGGDIPRRCYGIRLDAQVENPHLRRCFKHPDIKGHALKVRPLIVASILTMIRAWVSAGKPAPTTATMGSFENWSRVVGGILECAGVEGFLGNLSELFEESAPEIHETEALFQHLYEQFGERSFSTGQVYKYFCQASELYPDVHAFVPNDLQDVLNLDGKFQMKLGWRFRKHTRRPFGEDRLRILNVGAKRGATLWRFATGKAAK